MILIYNIAIRLYVVFIRLSALTGNEKAKNWVEGRKNWRRRIIDTLTPGEKRYWFHCSSLGEFEQGRPLIEKIKLRNQGIKIVLTFFSPSGYEIRKNYPHADYIFYLPADTKKNATDFISLVNPEKIFFIKYEYWHHYFFSARKKNIPLYVVSAVFREDQRFFTWYGRFFRQILEMVTHFFVQDEVSKRLLHTTGITSCTVTGDTRFDRVLELSKNAMEIPDAEAFAEGETVLVAGSTWPADEAILLELFNHFRGRLKLILAPHEISEEKIHSILQSFSPYNIVRLSQSDKSDLKSADILLIDNIGMLSSLYRYGRFAFIGGGFGKGIHNVLEAAVYGVPVFFGPEFSKFNEAKELIRNGGAFSITTAEELKEKLNQLMTNPETGNKSGSASKKYVAEHAGATDKIISYMEK